HRRVLPSFPTRRSSDLHGLVLSFPQFLECVATLGTWTTPVKKSNTGQKPTGQSDSGKGQPFYRLRGHVCHSTRIGHCTSLVQERDRKSTRLNSSHDQIS